MGCCQRTWGGRCKHSISFVSFLQKSPGAYPPQPTQAALRLRVLRSPPCSPADDTAAAAVPGRGHRLVSHLSEISEGAPVRATSVSADDDINPVTCTSVRPQGPQRGRWSPAPPVPAPAAPAALSALPGLPANASLPQKHILCTSGESFCYL